MAEIIRYDRVLPRLTPTAKYNFTTIGQTILSRKAGETEYTEITETVRLYTDYNAIIWLDDKIQQPTKEECEAEWVKILIEEDIEQVYEARRKAYPSISDQLDMLWHAMDTGILPKVEPMYSDCLAVKTNNPLPVIDET